MSYVSSYYHCVFSTKERRPLIDPQLRERLWPFLGGIARQNEMKAIAIGGVCDHVHMLISLPPTLSLAKALQLIKGGSSKWVHETVSLGVTVSRPFGTLANLDLDPRLKPWAITRGPSGTVAGATESRPVPEGPALTLALRRLRR